MTYQELLALTDDINFSKVSDCEYTTGSGWRNAIWTTQLGFVQFLNNCLTTAITITFAEEIDFRKYTRHTFTIRDGVVTKK